MKHKKIFLVVAILLFIATVNCTILASDVSLCNNNTLSTSTAFSISNDGTANVTVEYDGYPNITTGATINITIKKRTLLLFWSEVVTDSVTVSGDFYINEFYYQLEDKGTYKCNVEYIVSGTGGADDVIPFEDTAVYE